MSIKAAMGAAGGVPWAFAAAPWSSDQYGQKNEEEGDD